MAPAPMINISIVLLLADPASTNTGGGNRRSATGQQHWRQLYTITKKDQCRTLARPRTTELAKNTMTLLFLTAP
jgi:hypothetical protein